MNAVAHFEAVQLAGTWLAPGVAFLVLLSPWPHHFWLRCATAVLLGWATSFAFTVLVYNPAGIAAGHALGEHFPENRYDNNTTGIALLFGWLPPALAVGLYSLVRLGWLRFHRRGA